MSWFHPVFPLHCSPEVLILWHKFILVFSYISAVLPLPNPSVWVNHGNRPQQASLFSLILFTYGDFLPWFVIIPWRWFQTFFLNSSLVSSCSHGTLTCFDLRLSKCIQNWTYFYPDQLPFPTLPFWSLAPFMFPDAWPRDRDFILRPHPSFIFILHVTQSSGLPFFLHAS